MLARTRRRTPALARFKSSLQSRPVMTVAVPSRLEDIARPTSAMQRNLNLVRELAFTNFKLKYTGSALGYLWSLVKPLMLFGIMYAVFARLLKAGAGAPEFEVQLLLGIVLWNFFTEATSTAIGSIAAAGNLIRRAYFPRWILVVSSTLTALMTFVINTALIVVITVAIGHMHLSLRSLMAPLFFIELVALIVGLSLLLSALFVFYRDVGHIWEIISLVLFYASTIVFPFTILVTEPGVTPSRDLWFAGLNPIAQIVQDLRWSLVSPGVHPMVNYLGVGYVIPLVIVAVIFVIGFGVFHRLTPRFAENL
jgi:ABC-2 type transport system permease protein